MQFPAKKSEPNLIRVFGKVYYGCWKLHIDPQFCWNNDPKDYCQPVLLRNLKNK